jgi:hypothetical protein
MVILVDPPRYFAAVTAKYANTFPYVLRDRADIASFLKQDVFYDDGLERRGMSGDKFAESLW